MSISLGKASTCDLFGVNVSNCSCQVDQLREGWVSWFERVDG